MRRAGRERSRQARQAVLCGLGMILAAQLLLSLAWQHGPSRWRDPEYGHRLDALRRAEKQRSSRPLALVLGSSHVAFGIRPDACEPPPHSDDLWLFNCGFMGAGPIWERVCLDRFLRDGVRPHLLLLEVWPGFARQDGPHAEQARFQYARLMTGDVTVLRQYFSDRQRLDAAWSEVVLTPWYGCRFMLLSQVMPSWLPNRARQDINSRSIDAGGWVKTPPFLGGPAERQRRCEHHRALFERTYADFEWSAASHQAYRDILRRCRAEGISVVLVRFPEASDFRRLETPAVRRAVNAVLSDLSRDGTHVIDARDWMDDDAFMDGHHLTPAGAWDFTRRLADVLRRERP